MANINKLIDGLKAVITAMNETRKANNKPCITFAVDNYDKINIIIDNADFPIIYLNIPRTGRLIYSNQGSRIYNIFLVFVEKMCYDSDPSGEQIEQERENCFDMINEFKEAYNDSGLFQPIKGVINFVSGEIKKNDVNVAEVLIQFDCEPLQTIC